MNNCKSIVIHMIFFATSFFSAEVLSKENAYEKDCVILLHGLSRTSLSMKRLEWLFSEEGFTVVNQSYPSRRFDIEKLSNLAIIPALDSCGHARNIHFVTHSMGGHIAAPIPFISDHR